MKFGKKYLETLGAPGIPAEWRQTAIEYRKLKKVINRVASELEGLGLTSDVLKDLLEQQQLQNGAGTNGRDAGTIEEVHEGSGVASGSQEPEKQGADVRVESVEDKEEMKSPRGRSVDLPAFDSASSEEEDVKGKGKRARRGSRKRTAHASYELSGTSEHPEPRIRLVFDSASSATLSDSSIEAKEEDAYSLLNVQSSDTDPSSTFENRFTEVTSEEEEAINASNNNSSLDDESESVSLSPDLAKAGPKEGKLLKRMYNMEGGSDDEEHDWAKEDVNVEPKSRRSSAETVRDMATELDDLPSRTAAGKMAAKKEAEKEAEEVKKEEVADEADDEDDENADNKAKHRRHYHRRHRKEVFIPLNSDTEFLTLLAQALASLAALQMTQKKQFAQSVQILAREVSQVSSPTRPKSDLYVWREIFALWVEAQIFESEREKDRGERNVEDAEEKLDWFVDQVAKRKLAKKMKNKESRVALEQFIKLNVELLDMKKFQMANEEAARKILKKHDKRTALTASSGFPQFIAAASSLSTRDLDVSPSSRSAKDAKNRVLILPGFPSLPHILLSTLTSTLLPVIPQIDDYECAICGDLAFKPIRLECGHKFCVRCLVKMQKRSQDHCPQCRAPVVLRANAQNLDRDMQHYLEMWFPREVKAKEKSNQEEASKETLDALGLPDHKCCVQ